MQAETVAEVGLQVQAGSHAKTAWVNSMSRIHVKQPWSERVRHLPIPR